MRTAIVVFCTCCALTPLATASSVSLWAFQYEGGPSETIALDPFSTTTAAACYTYDLGLADASYDPSAGHLYVSGGGYEDPVWYCENTIYVYSGGPGGLGLVSYSNAGMEDPAPGYHWLGGIEYIGGSLYAVGYTGYHIDNVLLRIDNPGTVAQTVTQIGSPLGPTDDMGTPFNLCRDGQGGLFSIFTADDTVTLYRIDTTTGVATTSHSWPYSLFAPGSALGAFEGLTLLGDSLYGVMSLGRLWQIDLNTYEPTLLGELEPTDLWTGLTVIPEPSTLGLLALALVIGARSLRKR